MSMPNVAHERPALAGPLGGWVRRGERGGRTMLAANKLENVRRRVNRARRFPDNTCPASRHVHIIAEMLVHGRSVDPNEYEHVAGSLLSVLESLWKARTRLEKLDPRYGVDELAEAGKRAKSIAAGLRIE